ncbi:inositol polyphosphate kinase kcs1 [Perkinsus olseni]|uniref:3-ketoacyl-CoA synthase n=1 Tax=Perkinsus olseni TaxID=32597 RepID=A0A7J6P0X2_PEROL|nr:inositol polyphosphate kinase kcs1 [Perkinsus olseni]
MSSSTTEGASLPATPMFAEVHEPTTSVPFENRVAWTIRLKDYITVAFYRYRILWAILMAVVAVAFSYVTNGDALGWLQHNSVVALVFAGFVFLVQRNFFPQRNVYCIDHCEFNPPDSWRISREQIIRIFSTDKNFTAESLNFMRRLLVNSGTSDHTAFPPNMIKSLEDGKRWSSTLADSRFEGETTMSGALQGLMDKTGLTAKDIDILIVNCSMVSPTPSLCAMLVHKFGMRSDVLTYNLSGMGCSANGISIDLAQRLLQNRKDLKCVVVSTEITAQQVYNGNERGFLVQNTLFRCGATAILLTNKPDTRAKYKLLNVVRAQQSKTEKDYGCVWEDQDEGGHRGVFLAKNIVDVAGKTIAVNFRRMGPHILPIPELIKALFNKKYVPDFKRGINHFCIHAGGRGVLDGVQKSLKLSDRDILPSRLDLYHMGNTSSSSIWYELGFIERSGNLQAGHRILQVAFGSGFKCNSMCWLCLRTE